jgi:DNA polymerase elongation subunit (family B)
MQDMIYEIDEIESVEFIGEEFTDVYDVSMADTPHTFFANDILVHNSLYINIGKILDSMKIEERSSIVPEKMAPVIEVINTEIVPFVSNIINRSMDALSLSRYNCKENKISFKVEKVSRRSFFLEKKKYIMWVVYDGESKMAVDKLKATGIELVRSSTPKLAKKHMKDCLFEMLKTTNRELIISKLKDVRSKFLVADIDDIAFPSTANNLKKYMDSFVERGKFHRTPIHVRGSMLYNDLLMENPELRTKYDLIYEGDKIKLIHTKTGKDWNSNVISYKENWISELNIEDYIDREHQFDKAFFNPLSKFFNLLNWEVPKLNESEIEAHFNWG